MANPHGKPENLVHFKAKWRSGPTQVIRVPAVLADRVLEYARQIDDGIQLDQGCSNDHSESLLQVIELLQVVLKTPRNNFGKHPKGQLSEAIAILQSLMQGD